MPKDLVQAKNSKAKEGLGKSVVVGPPKLTRFERARIIGARALQISMGAPLLVTPPGSAVSPIDVAILELESKVLPMTIRRTLPDGTYQDLPVKWLV